MKKKAKSLLSFLLAGALGLSFGFVGCGKDTSDTQTDTTEEVTEEASTEDGAQTTQPDTDNFIELALNVYYNDGDHGYFSNESGSSIYVTEEGQYTLSFDCDKDLSEEAKGVGVETLTNLTAIYILDMQAGSGNKSPLSACNIMFDKVVVDDTELTITQEAPKSAFKSSGIFDTNDPINAWDGSQVEEVAASGDHVANFTTVENPKTVSVTFTLSDMVWGEVADTSTSTVVSANEYVNTAKFSDMDLASMNSLELTKYLGNGINLGNTMEAYGHSTLGPNATISSYETYWGQPVTTAEMVKGMKNCGFDTIRIPVSWTNMMDYENGDYTINTAYLDRVEEIVNYALDAEMFVIVNDHWDGGWWGMFGSATEATRDEAWAIYTSMWTQVAERFADYSEMLIFESANEELGNSLNANTVCPDSGALSDAEKYEMTTAINQKFIDIVRNSGGNNDHRFLLIAGYNTDIDLTCSDSYKMPVDTIDGKLFISVHYYTPWNYCGAETQARWGLKSEYETMRTLLEKMNKFTNAGYGVIFGEYAALPVYDSGSKTSSLKENTLEFTSYFLDLCDEFNYCPMLWSCNDFYNKGELTMISDEILELFVSRCYAEEEAAGDGYLDTVKSHMDELIKAAPEKYDDVPEYESGTPVAWIMWNGGAGTYSVGDIYNPSDRTEGITANDVVVDGAGTYTVSLEFAGKNDGLTFAALAIADGEILYPGCIINILEITADGKQIPFQGLQYTCSDDGKCTRVNLFNEWIPEVPIDVRMPKGVRDAATPKLIAPTDLVGISDITITFELITAP